MASVHTSKGEAPFQTQTDWPGLCERRWLNVVVVYGKTKDKTRMTAGCHERHPTSIETDSVPAH